MHLCSEIGLAEDDVKIAELINPLEEHGYVVSSRPDGITALKEFQEQKYDLLILDVMMPGLNGTELCRKLRSSYPELPILMLTALGGIDDKTVGFDSGADDYLLKPFHFKELLLRIKALLRRKNLGTTTDDYLLVYEDVSLNIDSKEVHRNGKLIPLTAKEFTLLELFLRNPNKLLSRQYIAEKAWDINFDTGTNVIDVYVNFLRNKIEKGFNRKLIHTKINMGYILR